MVWIFERWLPKPYRNPPNLRTSTPPDPSWNCLRNLFRFVLLIAPSSHLTLPYLCLFNLFFFFFLRFLQKTLSTWPPPLRVNTRNSRALKSTLAALKWRTHTVLHTSWNISPASTWRPLGALEFISNTDKYVLNHGGERFNLQLECKAPDNPLAALYCCYGGHSAPIQCRAETLHSVHLCELRIKPWTKS